MLVWELGIELEFVGKGVDEKVVVKLVIGMKVFVIKVGDIIVVVDFVYFRFVEVEMLLGDFSLVKKEFGWVLEIIL